MYYVQCHVACTWRCRVPSWWVLAIASSTQPFAHTTCCIGLHSLVVMQQFAIFGELYKNNSMAAFSVLKTFQVHWSIHHWLNARVSTLTMRSRCLPALVTCMPARSIWATSCLSWYVLDWECVWWSPSFHCCTYRVYFCCWVRSHWCSLTSACWKKRRSRKAYL